MPRRHRKLLMSVLNVLFCEKSLILQKDEHFGPGFTSGENSVLSKLLHGFTDRSNNERRMQIKTRAGEYFSKFTYNDYLWADQCTN